jgi:hypothetical protein
MELKRLALAVAFLIAASAPLAAQQAPDDSGTRAQQAARQRDDKAAQLTPPRRSLTERALYWYDLNGARVRWRAFHFSGGSFPGGAGMGYGIGLTAKAIGSPVVDPDAPNRIDGDLFAARSLRGYQRVSARMDVRNLGARRLDLNLHWQDYRMPQEDFYGIGQDSDSAGRSNYRHDGSEFALGLSWRPSKSWTFGSEVYYLTPVIGAGTDSRYPTTQSQYHDDELAGVKDLPAFLRADALIAFDWRDSATHPRSGGEYRATLSQYSGINDGAYDFRRLDVAAQQIIPLANRYRRIELRAGASMTDAADGSAVPFFYLPSVGGPGTLRGFGGSRFRDQNAAWARAEYQWEAWWAMDTVLFVDAGQVAAMRSDFRLKEFEVTYGVGFRLHSNSTFIARLDLAYGREGFLPILGFNYGF